MYQALYRIWRPSKFRDIVGQDAIVRTLLNQLRTGRTSHAYLFCGSRGTGKTSTAKTLAAALNCLNPQDGEPCGECAACLDGQSGASMDVLEIDAASNNGVDEIRDLRDRIMYPPTIGRRRVYIIDEVHMLSTGAFNALLKTLEEPPEHAVFILATTEPQKLPATILSRCQRFDFHRIRAEVIVAHLEKVLASQQITATPDALEQIALAAEGGMRDALSILDMCISYSDGHIDEATINQVLGTSGRAFMLDFCDALLSEDAKTALKMVDELMRAGRDIQVFLREIISHLRALMLSQVAGGELAELLETTAEDARRIAEQSERVSPDRLMVIMDIFLSAERDARYISHGRILLEMAITRVCGRSRVENIDELKAQLDRLEKRIENGIPAAQPAPAAAAQSRKPAARQAAPAPKAKPVDGDAAAKYKAAVDMIRKNESTIYMVLKKGSFAGVQDNTVLIEYQPGAEAIANMLTQPYNVEKLNAALSECFSSEMQFRAVVAQPAVEQKRAGDLEPIYAAFGRENVEVVDEL